MSTELIIVFVVLGIVVLGGVLYVNRNIEKEKAKKAVLIGTLSETAHRLQRIIDTIPDAYIHKDLKLTILNEMQKRLEKLVEVAPEQETFKKKLEITKAMITELQSNPVKKQEPRITNPQQANEIRALLQDLTKIIESFRDTSIIPGAAANVFLAHVHDSFVEANVSYLTLLGDQSKSERKWKLAVHHYQKGMAELAKRNQNGRYNDKLAQMKAMCDELNRRADDEAGVQRKTEEASELTKGLSDLANEEEAWKKKYF